VAAACGRQLPKIGSGLTAKHLGQYNYPDASAARSIEDVDKYGIKTIILSD